MNKRLMALANEIKESNIVDVGSDHGYLIKYLCDKHQLQTGIVIEVAKGPLENAKKTLKMYSNLEFSLSNGLREISNDLTNYAIVIAGMGGSTITSILENDLDKIENSVLYLQPANNSYKLRKFLINHDFQIVKETLIEDNKIIYDVLIAKKAKESNKYSEKDLFLGNYLEEVYGLWEKKIVEELKKYKKILRQIPNDNPKAQNILVKVELLEEKQKDLYEIKKDN